MDETAAFWEGLYAERAQVWSGRPNEALVAAVSDLAPGRALDLGCGEGSDTLWLAERGWKVAAVDVSEIAVARAAGEAAARGIEEGRIEWLVQDLADWTPGGPFDLVSACFLQSPIEFARTEVLRRAAGAVAAGGHLLVVGHAEAPPWGRMQQHDHDHDHDDEPGGDHQHGHRPHQMVDPAGELAALDLDPGGWETLSAELRLRAAVGPRGEQATLRDSVLLLRRC